jgi:hypothetical protein
VDLGVGRVHGGHRLGGRNGAVAAR